MSRTIFTNLTTLFVILSLYAFSGEVLNDFAFSLFVGCIAGTYSTIYIASPVSIFFHKLLLTPKVKAKKVIAYEESNLRISPHSVLFVWGELE